MAETIKIAVCDDEKNIRSYLVSLIKRQGGQVVPLHEQPYVMVFLL